MGAAAKLRKMRVLLCRIVTEDDLGRPRRLECLYDEETIDVSKPENRHFITALVEAQVIAPRTKGKA